MSIASSRSSLEGVKTARETKPVKLRSACNSCFAAKVRCDGNKAGCRRCTEKILVCTYSESMVGKVVGKRRKRPIPASKTNLPKPTQWSVIVAPAALPSPSPSVGSEQQDELPCTSNDWANMVAFDDQTHLDFSKCDEQQFINLELAEDSEPSTIEETLCMMYDLPTPSMNPPKKQSPSPGDLEARSRSRPPASTPLHQTAPVACHRSIPEASPPVDEHEDDETVCIKLLVHLKQFSTHGQYTVVSTLAFISRINAALRRLLQSRTLRTNYTCQLLLTNVCLYLATFCEWLPTVPGLSSAAEPENEFIHEAYLIEEDNTAISDQRQMPSHTPMSRSIAKHAIHEAIVLCSTTGNLLKRRPLNGFQTLGRQESAHVEIDARLRRVLASLSLS